jgi:type VI secretion system protein ImpG
MDPRLLGYYNRELQHLREMGVEFAREFPNIAGRLGLEEFECADPYVERLLESFAFLAARVQLKVDSEFPRFSQHLLDMVYPQYLAPTPSMIVVRLAPNLMEGALADGFVVPRGTVLRSNLGSGDQTSCEYRTTQPVMLWPLELTKAEYSAFLGDLGDTRVLGSKPPKAGLRLRLRATAGLTFDHLRLDSLPIFLKANDDLAMRLYEQLHGNVVAMIVRPGGSPQSWQEVVVDSPVRQLGFEDEEALLPFGPRSFQGYRLLQEYFAFPSRYMFVELAGLAPAVRRCKQAELEVIVLFDRHDAVLERAVEVSQLSLFSTPAVNLFPKQVDRIHLTDKQHEYHVVPDRTRPADFEIYQVTEVVGHGTGSEAKREFLPFYASNEQTSRDGKASYYTISRQQRVLSSRERAQGSRSSYVGSELYISLVDADEGPFRSDLRQLSVNTLCTNRDLTLHMSLRQGRTDFTLESGAPVESVRVVAGPTPPRPSHAHADITWRLISHLSLNYLSLVDHDDGQGAAALRELLMLYGEMADAPVRKQIEGIRSVASQPVARRLPLSGPISFGRGLEVAILCDETAFEGSGVFLLGAVLDRFFAKYVSINAFTETVVKSIQRGEIMRWPVRIGRRAAI